MGDKIKKLFNEYFDTSIWTNHTKEFQISDLEHAYRAGFNKGREYGYSDGYDEGLDHGMEQSLGLDA